MAYIPIWLAVAVAISAPLLSFIGSTIGPLNSRRTATELEARSRREETMRSLRWAAELSVSSDDARAELGVAQLLALMTSDLLDPSRLLFINAALDTVLNEPDEEFGNAAEAHVRVGAHQSADDARIEQPARNRELA